MDRLVMLPFLIGGVLIIVYRHRLARAFTESNRAFYGSLLGEERAKQLEGRPRSRRHRFNQAWGREKRSRRRRRTRTDCRVTGL